MQGASPPSIPGFFSGNKVDRDANNGYAKIEGTLQYEKPAFPVNKVKIECVQGGASQSSLRHAYHGCGGGRRGVG
jgi:hypothetical protein